MLLYNLTTIELSKRDLLRCLFGRSIKLVTEIELSATVEVVETKQTITIDPLRKSAAPAAVTVACAAPCEPPHTRRPL